MRGRRNAGRSETVGPDDDYLARHIGRASKQDAVIAMLHRPEGATVDEVASAMGWQRHTVRGLFSG